VVADAGVGKSRFVTDVQTDSVVDALWAQGHALAHTVDTPYAVVNDLIRDLLGVATDTSLEEVSGALAGHLARSMSPDAAALEWPFLANLLSLPLQDDATKVIGGFSHAPDVLEGRTVTAFTRLVTASAGSGPMVLVWEDLHWIDTSSLRLLEALFPATAHVPLLVVAMYRPGDGHAAAFHRQLSSDDDTTHNVIALEPLSRDHAKELVDGLIHVENIPAATRDLIMDRAQGNPLFLEELLRALIDAGHVVIEAGIAKATDTITSLEAIDIPETIHGIIGARIDRLPAPNKTTLQDASVLGRSFEQRVLQQLSAGHSTLDDELADLARSDFIEAESDRLTDYMFNHVFTQEAAYSGMLLARRKTLHHAAAVAIERLFPDRLDEVAPTLAGHYESGGDLKKATSYLIRAADLAVRRYANDSALSFTTRGLNITDDDDDRFELLNLRCTVLSAIGRRDDERSTIEAMTEIAESTNDDAKRLGVATKQVSLSAVLGQWDEVLRGADHILALADRLDDTEAAAIAHNARGLGLVRMNRLDEAEREFQESVDIADDADSDKVLQRLKLTAMTNLGKVYFGRKDFERGRDIAELTLSLADELGDRFLEGTIHQNQGILGLSFGDYDYCRQHLTRTIQIGRDIGSQEMLVAGLSGLGEAEFLDCKYPESLKAAEEALTIAHRIEHGHWVTFQMRSVADTLIALDRADEAIPLMEQSIAGFRDIGSIPHLLDAVAGLARAHMAKGDPISAAAVIEEAATHILDGNEVDGAAYPLRIHATCLDVFKSREDPRYVDILTAATDALYRLYPDGGTMPWHDDIRSHTKLGSKPRP
jgi:predicted ATPase